MKEWVENEDAMRDDEDMKREGDHDARPWQLMLDAMRQNVEVTFCNNQLLKCRRKLNDQLFKTSLTC